MASSRGQNPWDRIAKTCLDQVVSPLGDSVDLPLLDELRRIRDRRRLTVADLGCGSGTLLPALLDLFRSVVAIDGSREMLRLAARRVEEERPDAAAKPRPKGDMEIRWGNTLTVYSIPICGQHSCRMAVAGSGI